MNNLSVKLSYINNRGVWLNSDGLTNTTNELTPSMLLKKGLDVTNANDFNLLTQPISSPAVAARGFTAPYSTFPSGATLAQALRPYPQFGGVPTTTSTMAIGGTTRFKSWLSSGSATDCRRRRLLVVEESGDSGVIHERGGNLGSSDLSYHGTDSGSLPPTQEPEIL